MPEKDEEVQARVEAMFRCSPCLWQIKVARSVLAGKDVITVAPTGAGKSLTYWIPLAFTDKGIVMVVLPLKQLGIQFSSSLNSKGLSAISVTAENTSKDLYSDMKNGKYRVIMFSPEIIEQDSHFDALIKNKKFINHLINVVFDEAHCIKEWGSTFHNSYQKLGHLRHLMSWRVPYHLVLWLNTDRPNIFFCMRRMEYPINSYHDLAFLIPKDLDPDGPLPVKFLVFFNSHKEAEEGAKFLWSRLPPKLREKLKWVHSGMTNEFCEDAIHALKNGEDIGECATDAVGLGIDIPDVYIIVQYRVPASMSTWMQHAGCAIRNLSLDAQTNQRDVRPSTLVANKENTVPPDLEQLTAIHNQESGSHKCTSSHVSDGHPSIKRARINAASSVTKWVGKGSAQSTRKKSMLRKWPAVSDEAVAFDVHGIPIKVDHTMDDFINAVNRPEKCRRRIASIHFGNVGIGELEPWEDFLISLTLHQCPLPQITAALVARRELLGIAATSVSQNTGQSSSRIPMRISFHINTLTSTTWNQ
ncbi:P-loop containing nucleoside triphosphate hydrolase protein [Desarmillaria tabescens]|uniref:DNA 3'-5' helicase n=1 Tax=Armillaria tabescens TaxID=1929756 RepID=A0AA39N237_ARMTA|nr:P-loop containing nucleoside triphosphate hydrolase protein [Desarmillaria tabescens]KAK0455371.1 P-loop containing nucleoside triphosphate hydrolase protein [Desarmillaria tabescens]